MYDIDLIKKLLIKVSIEGDYSICDTCLHHDGIAYCRYFIKQECGDGLKEYAPNTKMIMEG